MKTINKYNSSLFGTSNTLSEELVSVAQSVSAFGC